MHARQRLFIDLISTEVRGVRPLGDRVDLTGGGPRSLPGRDLRLL